MEVPSVLNREQANVTRRTEYKLVHIWGAFCLLVLILFKYKEEKQQKVGQNGMPHTNT